MSDPPSAAAPDLEMLLEEIFALPDTQWRTALDEACTRHPSVEDALRRRFGCLERTGLVTGEMAAWPQPGQRFGSYRLLELVGTGGMGMVYRARRDDIDREVALKVLRPELAAHELARARFLREASAAARIQHPALCTLYDFGEHDGMPFLALRFVRGPTLAACIARARRTARLGDLLGGGDRDPLQRIVGLFAQLAAGLDEAHRQGLVHRDVKPENVVVEPGARPVLIDFGLARSSEATRLTRSGEPLGTPAYMAPEQVRGDDADARTDVYALAATLYECVTLRPPFQVAGREALYRAVLQQEVPDPRAVNPDLPRDLAVVLIKALQKDPAHRYASMRELAADLQRLSAGEPVRARPVPWPRRLVRFARQRPRRALAVATATAALLGLAFFAREVDARKRARAEALAASVGALQQRDPTVGALVAREAFAMVPDSETTRSNLLQSMARNLQTGEYRLGSVVGGWAPSPDGAVVVGLSNRVYVRDAAGLRALPGTEPHGVRDLIYNTVAWSRDGERFLVGAHDGTLLHFARDGSRLAIGETAFAGAWWGGQLLRPKPLIDGTADGGFVVGDRSGGVCLLDRDGRQRAHWTMPGGTAASVLLVQADPTGAAVLTVDVTGSVLRWQAPYRQPTVLHECRVTALSATVSADRRVLAIGDVEGGVHVVRLDGVALPLHRTGFELGTEVLALTADGSHLFAGAIDQQWALFRLGSTIEVIVQRRHDCNVRSAAFDRHGARLVIGDHAGRLLVLDRLGRERLLIAGHQDAVGFVLFGDAGRFTSGGWDGSVREWRLDVPGLPVIEAHDHAVFRVAWLDDGRHLVATGGDGKLGLLSLYAGRLAAVQGGDGRILFGLAASPDGREIASASYGTPGGSVKLWSADLAASRLVEKSVRLPLEVDTPRSLAWAGPGVLLVGAGSGAARLVDTATGTVRAELLRSDGRPAHSWDITHVSASSDGQHLASASLDGAGRLWRADGTWLRDLVAGSVATWSVDFTPEGSAVLIGFADGTLELRDLAGTVRASFAGVRGRISCARVSPDGRLVAAAASDGHLHVWTIAGERPWLRLPHRGLLHGLAFSPDSEQIAVACSDGTVRIWPVTDARIEALAADVFRELTPDERRAYLGR